MARSKRGRITTSPLKGGGTMTEIESGGATTRLAVRIVTDNRRNRTHANLAILEPEFPRGRFIPYKTIILDGRQLRSLYRALQGHRRALGKPLLVDG